MNIFSESLFHFFEHIGERYYRVVYKYLQTEAAEDDNYLILYFEDITDTERQKLNSLAAVPVFCDIEIDNLEEGDDGRPAGYAGDQRQQLPHRRTIRP